MYLLGYDLGSSSVKATLLEAETGKVIDTSTAPQTEMLIEAPQTGWAEQNPEYWWENIVLATQTLLQKSQVNKEDIKAIGIAYQMHGLVLLDKDLQVLRPSIIWCDSRAVEIGEKAFQDLGQEFCLENYLNSPANFTASKLKWVKENEPDIYEKIHKFMLPGDYIAFKMTGEVQTTISGLSEGICWDFQEKNYAQKLFDYYQINPDFIPDVVPTFGKQGKLTQKSANELGLNPNTSISYRAGDQPNNAFSLNVLNTGEVAATAGTSGVIYAVQDQAKYDTASRINTFAHVNYQKEKPSYGVLLCVNGVGILNHWLKNNVSSGQGYEDMNQVASQIPIGSEDLAILPFGNGAERMLENRNIQAQVSGWDFNVHQQAHFFRAAQEGIVFALNYGLELMKNMNMSIQKIRVGQANMFLSPIFREAFVNTTQTALEIYNTDGSQGAARGAGLGLGIFKNFEETFENLKVIEAIEPQADLGTKYQKAYQQWLKILESHLKLNS